MLFTQVARNPGWQESVSRMSGYESKRRKRFEDPGDLLRAPRILFEHMTCSKTVLSDCLSMLFSSYQVYFTWVLFFLVIHTQLHLVRLQFFRHCTQFITNFLNIHKVMPLVLVRERARQSTIGQIDKTHSDKSHSDKLQLDKSHSDKLQLDKSQLH
jgi:hypothetical protein